MKRQLQATDLHVPHCRIATRYVILYSATLAIVRFRDLQAAGDHDGCNVLEAHFLLQRAKKHELLRQIGGSHVRVFRRQLGVSCLNTCAHS
jgi:hypothetical protein